MRRRGLPPRLGHLSRRRRNPAGSSCPRGCRAGDAEPRRTPRLQQWPGGLRAVLCNAVAQRREAAEKPRLPAPQVRGAPCRGMERAGAPAAPPPGPCDRLRTGEPPPESRPGSAPPGRGTAARRAAPPSRRPSPRQHLDVAGDLGVVQQPHGAFHLRAQRPDAGAPEPDHPGSPPAAAAAAPQAAAGGQPAAAPGRPRHGTERHGAARRRHRPSAPRRPAADRHPPARRGWGRRCVRLRSARRPQHPPAPAPGPARPGPGRGGTSPPSPAPPRSSAPRAPAALPAGPRAAGLEKKGQPREGNGQHRCLPSPPQACFAWF